MGRRKKSSAKRVTKKQAVVEKIFKCPFCGHDKAVVCKMELAKRKLATLMCRVCGENFQARINCACALRLRCSYPGCLKHALLMQRPPCDCDLCGRPLQHPMRSFFEFSADMATALQTGTVT